jgi:outer membrane protein, heavy metal efflux system
MLKKFLIGFGFCLMVMPISHGTESALSGLPVETDSLTLEKTLELVFKNHPSLEAGRSAILAREAAQLQASKGLNPELGLEVEDVGGTGVHQGVDAAQTTLQISQTLEWGDKRGKRSQVATIEKNLAEREQERKHLELHALTHAQFMQALSIQSRLALAHEAKSLAERLLEAVTRRVKEGAASTADEIRARLAVSETGLEIRQDSIELEAAKMKLSLLWGEEKSSFRALRGDLDARQALPSLEEMTRSLSRSPQIALRLESVKLAQARLYQQQSLSRPDMTISAGIRHSAAPGDVALVGGISLPLPIRNRNQGGTEEAKNEVTQAKAEGKAALLELKLELIGRHRSLVSAENEIETLKEKLIPDAEKATQVLEDGYRRGRFGILDVLNSEAELFRHRVRYLDALLRYQQGYADLESLIGANDMAGKPSRQELHGKKD